MKYREIIIIIIIIIIIATIKSCHTTCISGDVSPVR